MFIKYSLLTMLSLSFVPSVVLGEIKYPTTEVELRNFINSGEKAISLVNITSISSKVNIPADVVWYPPHPESPISLNNTSNVLEINGPPAYVPQYKIFKDWVAVDGQTPSVTGWFAGVGIRVAWWLGVDPAAVVDAGPAIEAAARCLRPKKATLDAANNHGEYTGTYTGGRVIFPAGVWPVESEVKLSNTYCKIYGAGRATVLMVNITDPQERSVFNYASNSFNSGVHDLQVMVKDSCHSDLSVFYIANGAMEGSTFHNLLGHGCQKSIWELGGGSVNHFEISNCHFAKPHSVDSVGIIAHSTENNFDVNNTTIASIGSTRWKRGIDIQGGGNTQISRCHFEAMGDSAVYVSNERSEAANYLANIIMINCTYNNGNSFADTDPSVTEGTPLLWIKKHDSRNPISRVKMLSSTQMNSDVVIRDDALAGLPAMAGNNSLNGNGESTQSMSAAISEYSRFTSSYVLYR